MGHRTPSFRVQTHGAAIASRPGAVEHGAMDTRTIGEVSPSSPSTDGVANTARYSMSTVGVWVVTYVPSADPGGIAPIDVHADVPAARRWSVTVRPETRFAL